MPLPTLKLDALVTGIILLFGIIFIDMIFIVFALSWLTGLIPAEMLQILLRIVIVLSMLLPAYVCARLAEHSPIYHAFLIGLIEAVTLSVMMTLTFSWQGTLHDYVLGRIPLTFIATLLLNILAGWVAKKLSAPVQ
jgi:hypothetical protein